MNNNSVLKKMAIASNLKHFEIKEIFELGGLALSSSQIKSYMAGSQHRNYEKLNDEGLERFLNGFITYSRGPKDESYPLPRIVENHIIGLIESGNIAAIEEIRSLLDDAEAGENTSGAD